MRVRRKRPDAPTGQNDGLESVEQNTEQADDAGNQDQEFAWVHFPAR